MQTKLARKELDCSVKLENVINFLNNLTVEEHRIVEVLLHFKCELCIGLRYICAFVCVLTGLKNHHGTFVKDYKRVNLYLVVLLYIFKLL